ncbi:MAG: Uncharacterised protein [Owenweeksia sp. TMED14]|nr:MAG: Uncharacterised protein [Owenweeksia sp. TMED14]
MKKYPIFLFFLIGCITFPIEQRADTLSKNGFYQTTDSIIFISGSLLDSVLSIHRNKLAAEGLKNQSGNIERYTIQIFSGKRKEALAIYNGLLDSNNLMLHFDEPNFKVSVGLFSIRLSAEHKLKKWRENYPQSFVVRSPDVKPQRN